MRQVPAELVTRYEAEGWWTGESIGELLERGLRAAPRARFRVHSAVRPYDGTFRDVELVARRLAAGLRARGVRAGDRVVFQLPNWMEAAAVFWASAFLGAVVVPVVHFYGRKELGHILRTVRPAVFVTTAGFRHMEFHADLCADVPVVGVVGRDFDRLLGDRPLSGVATVDAARETLIAFTSGTTRDPKGVVHTHRTLGFETRQLSARYPPDWARMLTYTPVGHFIGMVSALLVPVLDGNSVNLMDVWDPAVALRLMASDGLVTAGGTTYFLTSLLDHPDCTPEHLRSMRYAGLGGGTIARSVVERLAAHGIKVFRAYGSTEHPSITASLPTAPEHQRTRTDGRVLPGVEIRIAPDGEILSRGPDLCLGYTDEALTKEVFAGDGWYRTGDLGVIDEEGCLTITGRTSDIIIRGGENISAPEVEDALAVLPGVAEAVVVAVPDAQLGERAAAVLRLHEGSEEPTLDLVRAHLSRAGLARQKWPESLHVVLELPRTASGKVQKYLLRRQLGNAVSGHGG